MKLEEIPINERRWLEFSWTWGRLGCAGRTQDLDSHLYPPGLRVMQKLKTSFTYLCSYVLVLFCFINTNLLNKHEMFYKLLQTIIILLC
jgi:hypothetical protein